MGNGGCRQAWKKKFRVWRFYALWELGARVLGLWHGVEWGEKNFEEISLVNEGIRWGEERCFTV